MTLPWKPIAELPERPDKERKFLMIHESFPWYAHLLSWIDAYSHWDDGNGYYSTGDTGTRRDFTHFIEITPP